MTSLMPAVTYGNERTNTAVITTGLSFGISAFRNLHFLLVWYPLSVCLKLPFSSQPMLGFACKSNCEFPQEGICPFWVSGCWWHCIKKSYRSHCGRGDFSQLAEGGRSCCVLRGGDLASLILSRQLSVRPMHISAEGPGQVPVLRWVSLQRRRGWVHIKLHSRCICLTLCSADPSQGSDLWLGLEPAKQRIQDLAWSVCVFI